MAALIKQTKPAKWIILWFTVSSLLVLWDVGYCLMRPHSMFNGKYNWLWRPYNLYAKVDHFYGPEAIAANDGFTAAQSWLNLIETIINLTYVKMATDKQTNLGVANLVGFSAAVMTLSKTVLYWLNDACSGWSHTRHNDLQSLILLWVIPNGAWIVFPAFIVLALGKDLKSRLQGSTASTIKVE
ncbi:hypothetical protein INT43_004420 [Umbelopsis isabellina]|uniref:Uncharacterized protein n=1 Tax=Mortierella isabellina TaxID=91625 RepID=A0A8H7UAH8_MORIS|nr:hypothetical protein INT43_004420 [Umbelopsis isabellina]